MLPDLTPEERELIARVKGETLEELQQAAPAKTGGLSKRLLERVRPAGKRSPKQTFLRLGSILLGLGFTLAIVSIIVLQVIADQMGGVEYFASISGQLAGSKEWSDMASASGLIWYSDFIQLYKMRWIIAAGIFSFFTVLAALCFAVHLSKKGESHE